MGSIDGKACFCWLFFVHSLVTIEGSAEGAARVLFELLALDSCINQKHIQVPRAKF